MATALGFVVFGVGCSMIYIGYKGIPLTQFWAGLLSGNTATGSSASASPSGVAGTGQQEPNPRTAGVPTNVSNIFGL